MPGDVLPQSWPHTVLLAGKTTSEFYFGPDENSIIGILGVGVSLFHRGSTVTLAYQSCRWEGLSIGLQLTVPDQRSVLALWRLWQC